MVNFKADQPLYTIGVVAELIGVHPETLRVWERNGLLKPARSQRQRLYSNNDIKRLRFISKLIEEKGLNLAGVKQMILLYPCWWLQNCAGAGVFKGEKGSNPAKPCWLEEDTYCILIEDKADLCNSCEHCQEREAD